jgi:tetratricopeptide (TPR) repeat protein
MGPPRSMLRIFVGCTSVDLKAHRQAARRLIEKFDEHAVVMEDFGAQNGDATQVSLAELASADVYILLLAWRYGTIPTNPPDETLSVTHLEYRAAKAAEMPRLIFLADPATEKDDGPGAIFPATVRDEEHTEQMLDFRKEVGDDRVAAFFTTPESAALEVAAALHRFLREREPTRLRPPFKLASRAPEFVGRTSELADLCQRLRTGQSVGLSALVAGLGGIGKSALAAEALARLAAEPDAFPGGVTWVRCDGREGLPGLAWLYDQLLADWGSPLAPEQLAQAQVAGLEAEVELRERALQAHLRDAAPALALLDNVEVGLPLARALDTLSALHITALVTARHTPTVSRLVVVRLDVLDPSAATQLFAERYREKGGEWDEVRDGSSAAAIVERLGWLPLAIELQAARAALRQVSVAQLNADLDRDRSQGLLGDPLDATRDLRYSFAQSLRTLSSLQRTRFAALGLPGGPDWPRSVIERLLAGISAQDEVASDNPTENTEAEPLASEMASAQADLDLLVALSLASLLPEGRLRLHPLLREYAHERWQSEPAATQAEGLRALLAGIRQLVTEQRRDFAALAREEELIVAALDLAQAGQAMPRQVIGVVISLVDYLNLSGRWRPGMRMFTWQLSACQQVRDRLTEGAILNNLGYLTIYLGQQEQAQRYFEQALFIAREVGDRSGEGTTLNNLGYLTDNLGQKAEAHDYYEQALFIAREVGDRNGEGRRSTIWALCLAP